MSTTLITDVANLTQAQSESYLHSFYTDMGSEDISYFRITDGIKPLSLTGLHAAADFSALAEGVPIPTRSMEQGYTETFTFERWALGYALSLRVNREMDAGTMSQFFVSFAQASVRRVFRSLFSLLNNARSTNRGDGVPTISASHPSNVGLQGNESNSTLDNAAFEAACLALAERLGHDGQLTSQMAQVLYTAPALGKTAYEILESDYSADDLSKRNISRTRGVTRTQSAYLGAAGGGSDTQWGVISRQAIAMGALRMHVFERPAPRVEVIAGTKADRSIIDQVEWEIGTLDWRGIQGGKA